MSCGYATHVEMMDNPTQRDYPHYHNRLDNASRCPHLHRTEGGCSLRQNRRKTEEKQKKMTTEK